MGELGVRQKAAIKTSIPARVPLRSQWNVQTTDGADAQITRIIDRKRLIGVISVISVIRGSDI